eukprot:gnl/MRDRNA2_/MRDRNA2_104589_c0_seq1.p1 gnl/MRDRNA2_/MRDRNA2_104589_c0~~gnl/MRDRNA2_/MRDRNA2_104589_c0_seq1.p1  ORF type:complete len:576 (+),score=101.09 gnl/MRDRNA2_/MRDRNA2_104589_c0_seq1:224-1729(+)
MNSADGVQELENLGNAQYLATITVGGQKLKVVPDTGSFSLLVTSTRCRKKECPRRSFDPEGSPTYEMLQREDFVQYGSGRVWTKGARDEVSLAGRSARKINFWEITRVGDKMETLWENARFDGIMGLGWRGLAQSTLEKTILETFEVKFLTFCFGTVNMKVGDMRETPSRIYWDELGAKSLGDQKFQNIQVLAGTVNHWAVKIASVGVSHIIEDKPFHVSCGDDQPCAAILDTGTSIISPPIRQLRHILDRIGPIASDCSNFEYLPTLHFWLGGDEKDGKGFHVRLPPSAYIRRISYHSLNKRLKKFRERMKRSLNSARSDGSSEHASHNVSKAFLQKEEPSGPITSEGLPEEAEHETSGDSKVEKDTETTAQKDDDIDKEEKTSDDKEEREYHCSHRFLFSLIESQHGPVWIIGAPFFQNYLARFDRSKDPPSVGLVKHPGICPGTQEADMAAGSDSSFFLKKAGNATSHSTPWKLDDPLDIPGVGFAIGEGAQPMNITL